MLLLEHRGGFGNLTSPQLRHAAGTPDLITEEISEKVLKRLTHMHRLFGGRDSGVEITTMADPIWMYQAVMFLDQSNVNITKCPHGILKNWFMDTKQTIIQEGSGYGKDTFSSDITKTGKQRDFWCNHIGPLLDIPDLVRLDNKRLFTIADKLYAWQKQKGVCPICNKSVALSDTGHHIVPYSEGGKTVPENCMLVHEERCHQLASEGLVFQAELST